MRGLRYLFAFTAILPGLAVMLLLAGLTLRLGPWRLPLAVHHFGGGFLWGALIYVLIASFRPVGWGYVGCLLLAFGLIAGVESVRLVHAPALDSFRVTLAGQLLLGRIFSPWNILVDSLGALSIAALTRRLL